MKSLRVFVLQTVLGCALCLGATAASPPTVSGFNLQIRRLMRRTYVSCLPSRSDGFRISLTEERATAMKSRLWRVPLLAVAIAVVCGCSSLGAKPWQRGTLAREDMQLGGEPMDAAIDDHLYFSREASSGGRGFAGGGCGCN
jgi:hypothetical protein